MNLINVTAELNTEEKCIAFLEKMRWPDGKIRCLVCGGDRITKFERKGKTDKAQHLYRCLEKTCDYQFSVTKGTIFENSHLPLTKWFIAIALIVDAKKSISANQIRNHLGIQYKTAWHLMHRIREAMQQDKSLKFSGVVEADETYVGGKYNRRTKRNPWEKPAVMGIIERGGKVIASHISTPSKMVLTGKILSPEFRHKVINHIREYVRGNIHTNTIENFWSLFKRGVIGIFHKVSVKHLPRYIDEFTFRFNNRKEADIFGMTVARLLGGSALRYKVLTAGENASIQFS